MHLKRETGKLGFFAFNSFLETTRNCRNWDLTFQWRSIITSISYFKIGYMECSYPSMYQRGDKQEFNSAQESTWQAKVWLGSAWCRRNSDFVQDICPAMSRELDLRVPSNLRYSLILGNIFFNILKLVNEWKELPK